MVSLHRTLCGLQKDAHRVTSFMYSWVVNQILIEITILKNIEYLARILLFAWYFVEVFGRCYC